MALTRPNLTRPLPRPAPARRGRLARLSGGVGASTAQVIYPWNFAVRTWIAFDPPNTPNPTWIEITGFIDTGQPITITHGRADGLADVNATTLSATADNTDGRWCTGNTAGVWYGLIRKGSWFKVEVIPPSGIVSSRFVGFLNDLPTTWEGQYASSAITASDRFERLGQAPAIVSAIQSEVLTDPNLAGNIKGYWNLHEASTLVNGTHTFGDTSGAGASPLKSVTAGGAPAGTGISVANAAGPGFDGIKAVTFNPPSSTQGTYLVGPLLPLPQIAYNAYPLLTPTFSGLYGTLAFWYQATTTATRQLLAGLTILTGSVATGIIGITLSQDVSGYLAVSSWLGPTGGDGSPITNIINTDYNGVPLPRIDDGAWHHIVLGISASGNGDPSGLSGSFFFSPIIDGRAATAFRQLDALGGSYQLTIGGAYDYIFPTAPLPGAGNFCDVAFYWADMYHWQTYSGSPANWADHYAAGATGFLGESTDKRIARVARYGGVPIPLTASTPLPTLSGSTAVYSQSQGPWTNLSPGAHLCGTQSMSGRAPLDVMQEAARTEGMPLFVDRSGYLALQPSTIRQNTSPAWTVDSRDLDPASGVADDFAYTTNQATITPNGQAAQTVIGAPGSPGRLSQAKYGVYTTGGSLATASLNPTEAQSLGLSVIQLRADPGQRWSPLVVEAATLATQAGYGPAWFDAVLATEISTPVRVTNLPSQLGTGLTDALVEGWTETITSGNIVFAFNVSPIQGPTYQLDDPVLGRLDTDGSTLSTPGGINATALTFSVATTGAASGSALWTTNGADFPMDINLGGEQVTLSGISGASSPQTFTASARSVNGVVASHPVNMPVSVWTPLTLAY